MIGDAVDLNDVKNLGQVLSRTPNGEAVAELAERLGLLTSGATKASSARRGFISEIAKLSPAQLSNEQSFWAAEFGRIVELIGLLQGQEKYLALKAKAARSTARSRIRRDAEAKELKVTATSVNDEAEDDPDVRDTDEQSTIVTILLASALAAKEATTMYLQVISREISFRCSQIDAKIY